MLLNLYLNIEMNRERYRQSLEQAQGSNEVTSWIAYFVSATLDAQVEAES